MSQTYDCRGVYAATLADLARQDPNVVVLVNDSTGSSKLDAFVAEQFVEVEVLDVLAEQKYREPAPHLAYFEGGPDPLVGVGGRHPDVEQRQVRLDIPLPVRVQPDERAVRRHLQVVAEQVRQALADGAALDSDPVEGVLERVYADVPREVWPAARMSIRAQLTYLGVSGRGA